MAQRGLLAPAPRPVLSPLARALSLVGARWRGGRAVEGPRLESVYTGNRIAGSNPAPSASGKRHPLRRPYRRLLRALRDHEAEMLLHRREIPVVVQQRVAALDTEGANDDVGRFADRDAQVSQPAIVPGGARGKIGIQKRHESIPTQFAFNPRSMGFISGALKNFEQDEVADQKRFPTGGRFQFGS